MTHFFSRLRRFFTASDDSGQSTAGLTGPGGPYFSHPLTAPGVGAVGLAHILHSEPLAQVPYFLRVADAGQHSCLLSFHLGPFPLSVLLSDTLCSRSFLYFNQLPQPGLWTCATCFDVGSGICTHTAVFMGVCVCVFIQVCFQVFSFSCPFIFVRIFLAFGRERGSTALAEFVIVHHGPWGPRSKNKTE